MIHTIRTVAVGDQESKIDSPIILYRGDREVEVEFTINGSKFTFTNGGNVIKSTNATHGQLVINTPTGENMFSEVTECHDGKVVFVITKEMIDELIEVGFYSFQIRLFDESQVSRVTIPPVLKGIDIRNPIAAEDETNVVDIALVDYSVIVKDEFEDLSTFLPDGNYNKTEWESKDVISGAKLNKIEDALYNINGNMESSDLALLNRVENINKNIHSEIDKLGNELESEVEELERELNNNIEMFKVNTNIRLTELADESPISILRYKHLVNDGDWTDAFETAFENAPCKVTVPNGVYNIRYIRIPSNSCLEGCGLETVFNVIADGDNIHNIITNYDYHNGNENITIRNFRLLCNRLTTTPLNAYGSGIVFANVKGGLCENVRVENPSLHCFDAMADKPYQLLNPEYTNNSTYDENKRSKNIIFRNCQAYLAGDDNFTCHHSDYVYFLNCRADDNFYDEGSENRNGFEVDDGCRNITVRDCYATRNGRGFEVKAHEHSIAPENVILDNCVADNCVIGFQVRHLNHHMADEPQSNGKNVTITNCKCYNPSYNSKFSTLNPIAMQISAYTSVYIYNFYCEGNDTIPDTRSVIGVQYKSRDIIINGLTVKGFTNAKQGLYLVGGDNRTDEVQVSNVYIDGGLECLAVGSGVTKVTLNNIRVNSNGKTGSRGVTCASQIPRLNNIEVSNAEVNIKHGSKTMNDINPRNVLWSGKALGGTRITTNDNIENYNYLAIRVELSGEEMRWLDFNARNTCYIKSINMGNATSNNASLYEMKLVQEDSRNILIEYVNEINFPDATFTKNNQYCYITQVIGVRL